MLTIVKVNWEYQEFDAKYFISKVHWNTLSNTEVSKKILVPVLSKTSALWNFIHLQPLNKTIMKWASSQYLAFL